MGRRSRLSPSESLRSPTLDFKPHRSRAGEGTRRATKGFAHPCRAKPALEKFTKCSFRETRRPATVAHSQPKIRWV